MSKRRRVDSWRLITNDVLSFLNSHDVLCGLGNTSRAWKARSEAELFATCRAWAPRRRPPGGYLARLLSGVPRAPHVVYCNTLGWNKADFEAARQKFCCLRGIDVTLEAEKLGPECLTAFARTLTTVQTWASALKPAMVQYAPLVRRAQRGLENGWLQWGYKLPNPTLLSELNMVPRLDLIVTVDQNEQAATGRASDLVQIQGKLLSAVFRSPKTVCIWFVTRIADLAAVVEWMSGDQVEDSVLLEEAVFGMVSFRVYVHSRLFG